MSSTARIQPRATNTGDQILDLVSNPFQTAIQLDAFWASLGTSVGITILLTLVFSLLRPRHTLVYAPKIKHADSKHAPPPLGKRPFAWIMPVLKTKEDVLVDKIGMDAVFFLRFVRMLRNMFLILGVVGLLIMIPVNVTLGSASKIGVHGFAVMTPLYVWGNGLWAQVVLAWAIDIIVIVFLFLNYKQFYRLRRQYFNSPEYQNGIHGRTVMLRDIPSKYRDDEGILRLTDEVNPTGALPKPTIARNVKILPDLIEEHEECVRKLESVLAKYLRNPARLPVNRPQMKAPKSYKGRSADGKVDAIEYLTQRIQGLEHHIQDVRERVDKRDAMPYGFATWEQISQAHTVAYAARSKKPHGTIIRLAPRPHEIIWKNMHLSKGTRARKGWMNAVWITVLTAVWTPLNAGIAIFLSNLSNLGSVWPRFNESLQRHRTWWAIVQGIAAPALTSIVYLVLPIIFRRLQIRAGDVTKTSRERHVLRNLYNFFTFNNLVVFSLFSAVWQFITSVINDSKHTDIWTAFREGSIFLKITTALCTISPFWVTWLLQRNLGAAIDLAQLWTLFYVWFSKTFLAPTPRQYIEWTAPPAFDYASYYNYFLFYTTVALCYATLQPIILVVTALYFCVDSVLKKYLLMYVFVTKTESGGQFWRTLFNRIIFATMLCNVFIAVTVKARGTWTMVIAIAPLLLVMLAFKWYCVRTFDQDMHYYHRTGMQDTEQLALAANPKVLNRALAKFRHPALDKPLITPMVSAKAKHVLSQIYSGRLGSTDATDQEPYTDIAMEPMNQNGKPDQNAPFELVPEAQQDFAYYKNRSDFREEGGDIYGRPDDLITERSQTPMSLMSGYNSRATTPYNDRPTSKIVEANTNYRAPSPPPQNQIAAPVPRKAVPMGSNQNNLHPGFRPGLVHSGYEQVAFSDPEADLSVQHGRYTDPYDDQVNLLRNVGNIRTPTGEFMSMDRWQTVSAAGSRVHTPAATQQDGGSYDYFRGHR